MNKTDFTIAKKLYEILCLPSTCYDENNNLKDYAYVVAIDDDVTSAIYAVRMARQIKKIHCHYPTILCVGGKGILSRHIYNKSEAEVLADICLQLGYPKDLVWYKGLETGQNTGENIVNVGKCVRAHFNRRPKVLFCVTKRQSLRYILTQQKQEPYLDAGWYVIEESIQAACKMMNAKSLCGREMMVHEVAAILPRCQQYAGKYQEYPPFEITAIDVLSGAAYLADKYCLKLGGKPRYYNEECKECIGVGKMNFIDYCRYFKLYISILLNKGKIRKAIDDAIWDENFNRALAEENFAI